MEVNNSNDKNTLISRDNDIFACLVM
jgi:hypothetical protein